jgi:RNA recognition motif-containing protein
MVMPAERAGEDMRIYAGNLSYSTTDASLAAAFGAYGAVSSAEVVVDRESGQARGFGFVEMPDATQAENAIRGLDRHEVDGRALNVSVARERQVGGSRNRRPRY